MNQEKWNVLNDALKKIKEPYFTKEERSLLTEACINEMDKYKNHNAANAKKSHLLSDPDMAVALAVEMNMISRTSGIRELVEMLDMQESGAAKRLDKLRIQAKKSVPTLQARLAAASK